MTGIEYIIFRFGNLSMELIEIKNLIVIMNNIRKTINILSSIIRITISKKLSTASESKDNAVNKVYALLHVENYIN